MQLFITDLSKIANKSVFFEKYADSLLEKDRKRFDIIKHSTRRLQFLVGRLLIYKFFSKDFTVEKSGKLTSRRGYLSLSHSANLVVLALSTNPIGVDTEDVLRKRNFKDISHFLKLGDCQNLSEFYQLFTQYEADYKLGIKDIKLSHTFLMWKNFMICIATVKGQKFPEVYEYYPDKS